MECDVKSTPILFSGPMVNAILDGRKTQTRRIVKPQPVRQIDPVTHIQRSDVSLWSDGGSWVTECPYGKPGDRLWIREAFLVQPDLWAESHGPQPIHYAASTPRTQAEDYIGKPSIHMPRWASRITLEITGVRVERLQDIGEEDALEEGTSYLELPSNGLDPQKARTWFRGLWETINGPGSWCANPWVWVVEFRRK